MPIHSLLVGFSPYNSLAKRIETGNVNIEYILTSAMGNLVNAMFINKEPPINKSPAI